MIWNSPRLSQSIAAIWNVLPPAQLFCGSSGFGIHVSISHFIPPFNIVGEEIPGKQRDFWKCLEAPDPRQRQQRCFPSLTCDLWNRSRRELGSTWNTTARLANTTHFLGNLISPDLRRAAESTLVSWRSFLLDDCPLTAPVLSPGLVVVYVGQLLSGRCLNSRAFQPFPRCLLEPLIPMK